MKTTNPSQLVLFLFACTVLVSPLMRADSGQAESVSVDTLLEEVAANPADEAFYESVAEAVSAEPERAEEIVAALVGEYPESARPIVRSVVDGLPDRQATGDIVHAAVRTAPDEMESIVEGALDSAPEQGESIAASATAALRDLAGEEPDATGTEASDVNADAVEIIAEEEGSSEPAGAEAEEAEGGVEMTTEDGGEDADGQAEIVEGGEGAEIVDEELETISVDFPDTEIRTILRSVADLYELNLVIPEELTGRASVRLRDVTWPQVFEIVLSPVGYTYTEEGGIVRIVPGEGVGAEYVDEQVTVNDDGTMTVNFENVPISEIVARVSAEADLNVVIPQDFMTVGSEATATVRLRNVGWEQVFDVSLSQIGYGYLDRDDIIRIETVEQIESVPPATRVVPVKYPSATVIAEFVRNLSGVQQVQVDSGTNVLIVTADEGTLRDVERLVERLDQPTQQVMIEAMFIEVSDNNVRDLGVNWQSLSGYRVGAENLSHQYERERASTTQSGSSTDRSQTVIEDSSGVTSTTTDVRQRFQDVLRSSGTSLNTQALFSADEFNVVLSALQQNTDARLVSNPTVVTMNAEAAEIQVVDHLYREGAADVQGTGQPGDPVRTTFDEPIPLDDPRPGIVLTVTPTISGGDLINLAVRPEINNIIGEQLLGDGQFAQTIPTIRQRFVDTNVVVKSGQTLAMSGLADEDSTNGETKVPFFGDIPILGRLFRSDSTDQQKKNQIIFVTATIADPNQHNYTAFIDEEKMIELGLSHRDVQGSQYNRTEEEERYLEQLAEQRAEARRREIQRRLEQMEEPAEAGETRAPGDSRNTRIGPRQRR